MNGCVHPPLVHCPVCLTQAPTPLQSAHQMRFHEAFHRSCARVLYKDDWEPGFVTSSYSCLNGNRAVMCAFGSPPPRS